MAAPINPEAVAAGSAAPPSSAFSPQQIRAAYGINAISQEGTGQTIAIIDAFDDPDLVDSNSAAYATSDLHDFDAYYNLPDFGGSGPTFTKLDQNGGTKYPGTQTSGTNWAQEEAADVEWAHVIAPEANIVLIEASSSAFQNLIYYSVLSSPGAVSTADKIPGVSVVSMSFTATDSFADFDYDPYFVTPPGHTGITFVAASGDSGAPGGYPAYSPNVVAVGGTSLTVSSGGTYSEVGWSGSGGGISAFESQSTYWQEPVIYNGDGTISPSGKRAIPDVAFDGDLNTGLSIYDSFDGGSNPWYQFGGTSIAAPCWAGLIAIADQIRVSAGLSTLDGPSQTLPDLYALPSADFHDITSGTSTGSPGYSVDYTSTTGSSYNLVTGLGTPKANLLVPDLALGPRADLTVPMTNAGSFTQGDIGDTYTVTVSNSGSGSTDGSTVSLVDSLPVGLTAMAMSGSGWSVNLAKLTATRSDILAAGSSYPPLLITVNVAQNAPASVTNAATVSGGGEVITSNDTASDAATIAIIAHTMTWNGPASGSWSSSNWSNEPPAFPNAMMNVVVDTASTVTVGSSQAANSLALSNAGQVTVAPGQTLSIVGTVTVGSGGAVNIQSGATLGLSGLLQSAAPATLNIEGGTLLANASFTSTLSITLLAGTGTVNTNGNNVVLAAPVLGGGSGNSLIKTGSGTLTLSSANSYAGTTVVSAGTLIIANSASLMAEGGLTVGSGAIAAFAGSQAAALPAIAPSLRSVAAPPTVQKPSGWKAKWPEFEPRSQSRKLAAAIYVPDAFWAEYGR